MKKIIYTIGLLMFATAVVRPLIVTHAADEPFDASADPYSTSNIFARILPTAMSENMFESFGTNDESEVGKDLYLKILKKTIKDPESQAVKNTAGKYGLTLNDLEFVRSGSYQPILAKRPTMSQEDLLRKTAEIRNQFEREKQMLELRADMEAATSPSEVFANGDVSDSGFDLINDLSIIDKLLFLKTNPIDIGNAYNKEKSGGGEGGGQTPAPTPPGETPQPAQTQQGAPPETQQPTQEQTQETCPPGTVAQLPGKTGGTVKQGSKAVDPNSCLADSEVATAIKSFEETQQAQSGSSGKLVCTPIGSQQGQGNQPGAGGTGTQETGTGAGADTNPNADFLPEIQPPPTPPIQPAPADDWSKPKICIKTFCLFINKYYETPTSKFNDPDNCIACHAEKIVDQLRKTLSHSVSPNKIPGNLIETPKCKNGISASLAAVSMNVNVQFMPIKTPLNDQLILGSSLQNDTKYLCDSTLASPLSLFLMVSPSACQKTPANPADIKYEDLPSLDEQVAKRIITTAADNASYDDILNNVDNAKASFQQQQEENAAKVAADRSSNPNQMFYKALITEVDQMNFYFYNINGILNALHDSSSGACTTFKNKKTCT